MFFGGKASLGGAWGRLTIAIKSSSHDLEGGRVSSSMSSPGSLTACPWKMMVGRLGSFQEGICSGAMLNFRTLIRVVSMAKIMNKHMEFGNLHITCNLRPEWITPRWNWRFSWSCCMLGILLGGYLIKQTNVVTIHSCPLFSEHL